MRLRAGGLLAATDRRFALAHGGRPASTRRRRAILKPSQFYQLKRDEKLAQLGLTFDADSGLLTLTRKGKPVVRGDATDPTGRLVLTQFFATFPGRRRARPAPG